MDNYQLHENPEAANEMFVSALIIGRGPTRFLWGQSGQNGNREEYNLAAAHERNAFIETLRSSRDACPSCGVRADIHNTMGCKRRWG